MGWDGKGWRGVVVQCLDVVIVDQGTASGMGWKAADEEGRDGITLFFWF